MFNLRVNSNNDRKDKSKINYKNWEDIVTYPEHKNKSRDLINEADLDDNLNFIDKTESFKETVEKFARDMRWRNKHEWKNMDRKLSEDQMEAKLLDKQVATNYTVQENNVFLQKKLGMDREKIIEFYKKSLDSILETSRIDKERVIFATIHFDQSSPHLHFSISNIQERSWKHKNGKRYILLNVNGNDYNPVTQLKKQMNNRMWNFINNDLDKYQKQEFIANRWKDEYKEKYPEVLDFHLPIRDKINTKYKKDIYKDSNDNISMEKVRGYKRDVNYAINNTDTWNKLKNNVIYKFRETKLIKEWESSQKEYKDDLKVLNQKKLKYLFQMNNLKIKHKEAMEDQNKSLKPNVSEQNVLNKKKYFLRKDIDLFMLWGKKAIDKYGTNEIKKNRLYNNLLYLCHEEGLTPQELIKSIYRGDYKPKDYKDAILANVQNNMLRKHSFEVGKTILNDLIAHGKIKETIEKNIDGNIELMKMFLNTDENGLVPKEEYFKSRDIGIDAIFIKQVKANYELKRTSLVKNFSKKDRVFILGNSNFQKSIIKNIEKTSYSNKTSISKIFRNSKSSALDSLQRSINKEMEAINRLHEKNRRDIEWENELER